MNELLLREILNKFDEEQPNIYEEKNRTNVSKLVELELKKLNIPYKKLKRKFKKGQYFFEVQMPGNIKPLKLIKNTYPNNTKMGWKISNDKLLTEKFLKLANIKTPNTAVFSEEEFSIAEEYVSKFKGRFIIKPLDLSQSLGVYLDVPIDRFTEYWESCISIQKEYNKALPKVIVQEYVEGMELRIVVNEGQVGTATIKVPAFVIGDGQHNIKQLINKRNNQLQENPYLLTKKITQDEELDYNLAIKDRTVNTVLSKGEICILFPESSIGRGRTFFEVTEFIHPNIMKQAEHAAKAIPGLQTTGIDIIIRDFNAEEGTIIEVNKSPAYQLNYYPEFGNPSEPLNYVVQSLVTENKILDKKTTVNDLTSEEVGVLIHRYRFIHDKLSVLDQMLDTYMERETE